MRGAEQGVVGTFWGPSSQTLVGVLAPEPHLLAQPQEQHKAFAQEQADIGQDFCLMHCQAKKLLWEVKFFMGGKNTAVI